MSENASKGADYHRTFEKFSMGMWPIWKHNSMNFNYRGQNYHRREQEDAYAKRVGAFYAHLLTNTGISQKIRIMPKPDQDFSEYATLWEDDYSVLTAIWSQRVEPVVDNNLTVVGHLGWFSSSEILIPAARYQTLDVQSLIAIGDPIFAGPLKMPSYYKTNYVGQPEWKFLLFTAPDGAVLEVLSYDVGVGAVSTMPPWEIFSIVKSVVLLARTGIQQSIKMVARRRAARQVAMGPTKAAAEKAASTAVPVQAKRVTQADMLAWEKEGGHVLQNHGPQLTRENLKARIMGKESIPAPQMQPGGVRPADLRVWRGQKTPAASRWESDEIMRKAIGDVINKNLDTIRRTTRAGGEVILERQVVGYKTGSGWLTTGGPKATQAAVYNENLQGMTIVIRSRKNYAPTAKDPEGWYVHTAFPDVGH